MINKKFDKGKKHPWQKDKYERGYTHTSESNFYVSTRWRNVRSYVLKTEPLCRECLKNGKITPAYLVDHIVPIDIDSGDDLKYGLDNLQPLCNKCHVKKGRKDNSKFGEKNLSKGRDLMNRLES